MALNNEMSRLSLAIFIFYLLSAANAKPSLMVLNEDNWSDMLNGEWLVKFYAPWCPACKALDPTWQKVAGWSEDLEVNVAEIDVTENPGLSGRFMVTSLPTIYHVKDGQFRVYKGSRSENDFVSFVDDKKYQQVEAVPWYTSPTSIHMGALGLFFKVSMGIRDAHNRMTSDYGIPVWGSYIVFACITVIAGLVLGLVIVFLCDVLFPPQPQPRSVVRPKPMYDSIKELHRNDEDKGNDSDILDDRPASPSASSEGQSSGSGEAGQDRDSEAEGTETTDRQRPMTARQRKPRTTAE